MSLSYRTAGICQRDIRLREYVCNIYIGIQEYVYVISDCWNMSVFAADTQLDCRTVSVFAANVYPTPQICVCVCCKCTVIAGRCQGLLQTWIAKLYLCLLQTYTTGICACAFTANFIPDSVQECVFVLAADLRIVQLNRSHMCALAVQPLYRALCARA